MVLPTHRKKHTKTPAATHAQAARALLYTYMYMYVREDVYVHTHIHVYINKYWGDGGEGTSFGAIQKAGGT